LNGFIELLPGGQSIGNEVWIFSAGTMAFLRKVIWARLFSERQQGAGGSIPAVFLFKEFGIYLSWNPALFKMESHLIPGGF